MLDRKISELNICDLLDIMPHRYPFLLVDKIVEFEIGKRVKGIKNVTINEPYFTGHFPELPIVPGVMILESMAQVAGTLLLKEAKESGEIAMLIGVDRVKFRKVVKPGDQMNIQAELIQRKSSFCKFKSNVYVDNSLVAEGELLIVLYKEESIRDLYTSNSDNR
ncbi:MAG TPA: 3-hydroxyacyl-ACP dehydratase FabZ [bacterium]|jgi:beta-hydroxyacyl-ACP dehydratase FabZ|nr:3-hydroxyacyl-ACP dehydratase FabZ [Dictyoglomota bacterium]HHV80446.1 3-hydroxyacyl-ACP dehydratase FabZ [bacterium]HOK29339.1 3-hydroxyacyl-ACP dehydratase FabZ [bacterium]HOL54692.1 3-hydroxyacyl-ACP dehydratase FabZ [bacterium]HON71809.1 3-hydroxyacyl-ACP dehydratase FabZ [bacterium]